MFETKKQYRPSMDGIWKGVDKMNSELFAVYLTDGLLYDKLHSFAAEYSLPVELLVNLAVKRFVDDIELVRNLRLGKVEGV